MHRWGSYSEGIDRSHKLLEDRYDGILWPVDLDRYGILETEIVICPFLLEDRCECGEAWDGQLLVPHLLGECGDLGLLTVDLLKGIDDVLTGSQNFEGQEILSVESGFDDLNGGRGGSSPEVCGRAVRSECQPRFEYEKATSQ